MDNKQKALDLAYSGDESNILLLEQLIIGGVIEPMLGDVEKYRRNYKDATLSTTFPSNLFVGHLILAGMPSKLAKIIVCGDESMGNINRGAWLGGEVYSISRYLSFVQEIAKNYYDNIFIGSTYVLEAYNTKNNYIILKDFLKKLNITQIHNFQSVFHNKVVYYNKEKTVFIEAFNRPFNFYGSISFFVKGYDTGVDVFYSFLRLFSYDYLDSTAIGFSHEVDLNIDQYPKMNKKS